MTRKKNFGKTILPSQSLFLVGDQRKSATHFSHGKCWGTAILLLACVVSNSAMGQDRTWNDSAGGSFEDAANWNPTGAPTSSDNAIFRLSSDYVVRLNQAESILSWQQSTGSVTLFGGFGLTAGTDSNVVGNLVVKGAGTQLLGKGEFRFGNGDDAGLTIDGGTVANTSGFLGYTSGSTGTANVTGAGSFWNNTNLFLGALNENTDAGVGVLKIGPSGVVHVGDDRTPFSDPNGQLIVSDSGGLSGGSGRLAVRNGSRINNGSSVVGSDAGSYGRISVDGPGSQFNNTDRILVGFNGSGRLDATNGAIVSASNATIGLALGSGGQANINGKGSQLDIANDFVIGGQGVGIFIVDFDGTDPETGGVVSGGDTYVGKLESGEGYAQVGGFSIWNSRNLSLGFSGVGAGGQGDVFSEGTVNVGDDHSTQSSELVVSDSGTDGNLRIYNSSVFRNNSHLVVGKSAGASGSVTVSGAGSTFNADQVTLGDSGQGHLHVEEGAVVTSSSALVGATATGIGHASVTGAGSEWNLGGPLDIQNGTLGITSNGKVQVGSDRWLNSTSALVISDVMTIGNDAALTNDGDTVIGLDSGSTGTANVLGQWENASRFIVGASGEGKVQLRGILNTGGTLIGTNAGSKGIASVSGEQSIWNNSGQFVVGESGDGLLDLVNFGEMHTQGDLVLARQPNSKGLVAVEYSSILNVGGRLQIAELGQGTFIVENQGVATSDSAGIGFRGDGTATVDGFGSSWTVSKSMSIGDFTGGSGVGRLNILNSGLVSVGISTYVEHDSSVFLDGGRFEFGTTDYESISRISGSGGQLAGNLALDGFSNIAILDFSPLGIDTSEVAISNSGVIYGTGAVSGALTNQASGELRTVGNEWARFGGLGSTNAGKVNNFGGIVEFEQDVTNLASGFIGGRGQFITGQGLVNEGTMGFSGGNADVLGSVSNIADGTIITTGYGITTFFNDVVHNGAEIRTQVGSATVFLGAYSGAGSLTGTGDVFFEGDVSIGNSPDVVTVEGNLHLGTNSSSLFELAGLAYGEFDKFIVYGDMSLDGQLTVELLDDFRLAAGQEFLIAEIGGLSTGQFDGLSEGALIGNFSGTDLFISYARGDGNDVGLFTSVPEPGSIVFLGVIAGGVFLRRRRYV